MNKLEPIIVPKGKKYLNTEVLKTFPVNCLFNKGRTGCGGTELVINGNYNLIIAVPTKRLIWNKINPNTNRKEKRDWILGIYQGVSNEEIVYYIRHHQVKKIMVTYDSLCRITRLLKEYGEKVYTDYFLLIDECHRLFTDYSYRDVAINNLLPEAEKFSKKTYMSATPIEERFLFNELKKLPIQEVIWEERNNTRIDIIRAKKIQPTIIDIVQNKNSEINYHIFVNSVKFISSIINNAQLPPDKVKIVCSDTPENKKKLGIYKIEATSDPVKEINFYTSASFEGEDIYDRKGRIIIISDDTVEGRALDITTSIKQIIGRIRDYTFETVTYICPWTKKQTISVEEYKQVTDQEYKACVEYVDTLNKSSQEVREIAINKGNFKNSYIKVNKETNTFEADKKKFLLDIYNYEKIYAVRSGKIALIQKFTDHDIQVNNYGDYPIEDLPSFKIEKNPSSRISFKNLFEEYVNIRKESMSPQYLFGNFYTLWKSDPLTLIEKSNPLVKQAYELLGPDKVKELNYKKSRIQQEIKKVQNIPQSVQIKEIIKERLGLTPELTWAEWKVLLNDIYTNVLGLKDIKAKASDLKKWYHVKETQKSIEGKTTDFYTIIRPKTTEEYNLV